MWPGAAAVAGVSSCGGVPGACVCGAPRVVVVVMPGHPRRAGHLACLVVVVRRTFAALAAAVRMTAARRDELLVLRFIELRQALDKRRHVPDVVVPHAGAPGRHARRLDAVLDRPERFGGVDRFLRKVRERRVKSLGQFSRGHARCEVALRAHGVVVPRALPDARLAHQVLGRRELTGAAADRAIAQLFKQGVGRRVMRIVGPDVVDAGADEAERGAGGERERGDGDHGGRGPFAVMRFHGLSP